MPFINRSTAPAPYSYRDHGDTSASVIDRLQNMQKTFENGVRQFQSCDTKAQEVLKLINKNRDLWGELNEKLEVRVIKSKEDGEITLHPKDEPEARWAGKYHVYITIQHEDRKLVIDPYIGGENSCAHVDERDFIKANWKGEEGNDYVLETVAPLNESYDNGNYTPMFSLHDYMYNLFDPITYESHKFFYE